MNISYRQVTVFHSPSQPDAVYAANLHQAGICIGQAKLFLCRAMKTTAGMHYGNRRVLECLAMMAQVLIEAAQKLASQ